MQKQRNLVKWLGIAVILIQLFDIVIHVRADQAEPLRITANIVICAWIIAMMMAWLQMRLRPSSLAAIGIYLLLNLIFLVQNGLTNPEQGDAPRIALFVLVIVTIVLSGLVVNQTAVSNQA